MKSRLELRILSSLSALLLTTTPIFGGGSTGQKQNAAQQSTQSITLDECEKWCQIPKGKDLLPAYVIIDANTGKIIEGATRFAEGEKVQVIFVNKNPFKYSYSFKCRSQSSETSIIASFLGLIPGFGPTLQALGVQQTTQPSASNPCLGDDLKESNAINDEAQKLEQQSKVIAKTLNDLTEAYKIYKPDYEAFLKATDVDAIEPATLNCVKICNDAKKLLQQLPPLDLAAVRKTVAALNDTISSLEARAEAIKGNDCRKLTKDKLAPLTSPRKEDLKSYNKRLDELSKAKEMYDQLVQIIRLAFASEHPFVEVKYPQTLDGPTGIACTIHRKNLRNPDAKEEDIAVVQLQVGENRISLSAGIGFSTTQDTRIIRQPFANDDGTIGARFAEENKSTFKPSGVVMLNAHLCHLGRGQCCGGGANLAVSTGLVLSSRNNTTEAEFVAGPSVGLLKNTVFLTFGYHAARVDKLGGGFTLGEKIPSNLQDPLPVERNWKSGFMFAITYKIR